jgi:TRAP-type C4-dicarboxylate transport system permease small subunit
MIALTVENVIARYVFNSSFTWGEELVGALAVWCVFLGASACYKRGMHIGIDIVVALLPSFPKRMVRLLVSLVVIITTAYLSYLSLVFSISAWMKRTQVLEIRYTYIDIAAFIGFSMMTVYGIRQFVDFLRNGDAGSDHAGEGAMLDV